MSNKVSNISYHDLNAELNLYGVNGEIQFEKDKEAVRQYFLQHVNPNTVFFHSLSEKLDYLISNDYYDPEFLDNYSEEFIKSLFKQAYAYKYRFETFLGAYKYYSAYTLKTFDNEKYLERYEDRVSVTALYLAQGDERLAKTLVDEIITGRFQPATPTFMNAGLKKAGRLISCFLLRSEDNIESIGRVVNSAMNLSKGGGGVGILLTNVREAGAPIKGVKGMSSGVIPYMKVLEDSFSWINQSGKRSGAGVVYLSAHHPDIMTFLDSKRENADEKVRIKTLSLGIVIPDITFELAKKNEPMYLFSPYDVERVYGVAMSDISITEKYEEMVQNPEISKTKINAREFFQTVAEITFQSGYPFLMFEDTVNRVNPIEGRITMSNLCSEILQVNTPSIYNEDLSYAEVGSDISCNLGSMNIAKAMESPDFALSIETAIRALTSVSNVTSVDAVPSIKKGNDDGHAIGLGAMNLAGYLASNEIYYGSEEGVDFTNIYFYATLFYALQASNAIAIETGKTFKGFEKSTYATVEFFKKYLEQEWVPKTDKVKDLFENSSVHIPSQDDWLELSVLIQQYGLYNQNLQAVPPTGSISYINNSTSSIHPITAKIEIRKEGKIGRVYYPAYGMTNDNLEYYQDAYEIGYEKLIDTYAAAQQHIDQGMSMTLFFMDTATTRDLNKAYVYAWKSGIKTIYYSRIRQMALEGTEVDGCVGCML